MSIGLSIYLLRLSHQVGYTLLALFLDRWDNFLLYFLDILFCRFSGPLMEVVIVED